MRLPLIVCSAALLLVTACEDKPPPTPAVPDAGPAKPKAGQRPPFPNMATAAWGAEVMEKLEKERAAPEEKKAADATAAALSALHELASDAADRTLTEAVHAHARAEDDGERSLGAALAAVALVLDERVEGYRERLIDAHGLAAYAGTLEGGTAVAQAARAFVAVAAGRVYDGKKLVDVMAKGARRDADTALLLAHARWYLGERGDELIATLDESLVGRPDSERGRALLAQLYVELGLGGLASTALQGSPKRPDERHPWLRVLDGRAVALFGATRVVDTSALTAAIRQLKGVREGEARYLLARSLVGQKLDLGTGAGDTVRENLDRLRAEKGFEHEANLLAALLAHVEGDYALARAHAEKTCRARGVRPALAIDCRWTLVEACAGLGDAACVAKEGKAAVGTDGNRARMMQARAALALVGGAPDKEKAPDDPAAIDVKSALREAHLLEPFDAALGKQVGEPVAVGGRELTKLVRGARRALALGAPKAADRALEKAAKEATECRVCRALYAQAAVDADESARRAVAALGGKGPPLALADDAGKAALSKLDSDARPEVKVAVARAKKEQANPDARAARKAEEAKKPEAPGTVPVPSGPAPGGAHGDHQH
jgi:hypothetical protein